jgi:hypothetical protein
MATTVKYNGEVLDIEDAHAELLLERFQSGESGVLQLVPPRGYGAIYIAYGPGIPFVMDTTDD